MEKEVKSHRQAASNQGFVTNCRASNIKLRNLSDKVKRKYMIDKKTGERHWMTSDEIDSEISKH